MKNSAKSLLMRFFVASTLTTSFIPASYTMEAESALPHETLAILNTFSIANAERVGQAMAGSYLGKKERISGQIAEINIEKLESDFNSAYEPIKTAVNPKWEIIGEIPSDAPAFFEKFKLAQGKKHLLTIALAKKEIFEREKEEAHEYYQFLASAPQTLAIILKLKDFKMPPPPQGQTYFGTSTIFSRLMKINYFKRTTCFN
ncbi:MAG: hypothetical protein NWR39_00395, partial [Pseudomonadota bacterium]|nr:hypothetical protein [Pseudomonadota bacterium]